MRRNWDELRQRAAEAVHSIAIDADGAPNGSYQPPGGGDPVAVHAIKTRDLVELPDFTEAAELQTVLKLLKSEVNAQREGTVTIGEVTYQLARLLEDNGVRTRWAVK